MNNTSYTSSSINFKLDPDVNKLLEDSAARSGRSKRNEARFRLKDHLLRFSELRCIGDVKKR